MYKEMVDRKIEYLDDLVAIVIENESKNKYSLTFHINHKKVK